MLKCNKNLKVIWVSWMHSTWNEECISHASGQAGVAMAPGMKGRKSQKRRRHKDEPPNLWTNFSNSCLAPELHVFGRCQHAPGEKQQLEGWKKQKQAVQKFSQLPWCWRDRVWSLIPISLMVFGKHPRFSMESRKQCLGMRPMSQE